MTPGLHQAINVLAKNRIGQHALNIQCQLRERIETLDFRGQKVVYRVADTCLFAHGLSFTFVLAEGLAGCVPAVKASVISLTGPQRFARIGNR